MEKSLGYVARESALIIFSILVALGVNEWRMRAAAARFEYATARDLSIIYDGQRHDVILLFSDIADLVDRPEMHAPDNFAASLSPVAATRKDWRQAVRFICTAFARTASFPSPVRKSASTWMRLFETLTIRASIAAVGFITGRK